MSKQIKTRLRDVSTKSEAIKKKCEDLLLDSFDTKVQIAREKELMVMRDAHTLLINKQAIQDHKNNKPKPNLEEFINYTDVDAMIQKLNKPILEQIPGLRNSYNEQSKKLALLHTLIKSIQKEQQTFAAKQKELTTFHTDLNFMRQTFDQEAIQNRLKFEQNDERANRLTLKVDETKALLEIQRSAINTQNDWIRQFETNINDNQKVLQNGFDEWFKTIKVEQGKHFKQIQELEVQSKLFNKQITSISVHIKEQLQQTIKQLTIDKKNDDKRYDDLNRKVKVHHTQMGCLSGLTSNMNFIISDISQSAHKDQFLQKTLPALIHLQICEAMQKVVGEDYQRNLVEFEKAKTIEIDNYIKNHAGKKSIKNMHEKLLTFIKFIVKHNQGACAFTYGEDVHQSQTEEDLEHMNQSYTIAMQIKSNALANQEFAYREAHEQIMVDIDAQSDTVLRHKIKRLLPHQIKKLSQDFVLFKLHQKGLIDDFKIIETVEQTKARIMSKMKNAQRSGKQAAIPKMLSNVSKDFPDKLYVVKSEKKKPYLRLEQKFLKVFDKFMVEYRKFKDQNYKNFEKTTQMVLAMGHEQGIIKKVFEQFHLEFEEHTQDAKKNLEMLELENKQNVATFEKKNKVNALEIDKCGLKVVSCQKMVYENQTKNEKKHNELQFKIGAQKTKLNDLAQNFEQQQQQMKEQIQLQHQDTINQLKTQQTIVVHQEKEEVVEEKPEKVQIVTEEVQQSPVKMNTLTMKMDKLDLDNFDKTIQLNVPISRRSHSINPKRKRDDSSDKLSLDSTISKGSKQSAFKKSNQAQGNQMQKVMFNKREMLEKKRKKELAIKQKNQEREEKLEQDRIKNEMKKVEEERKQVLEEYKQQQSEKIEQKKKAKEQLMGIFKQESLTTKMAGKFKDILELQVSKQTSFDNTISQNMHEKHYHQDMLNKKKLYHNKTLQAQNMNSINNGLKQVDQVTEKAQQIIEEHIDLQQDNPFGHFDIGKLLESRGNANMDQVEELVRDQIQGIYDTIYENNHQVNQRFETNQKRVDQEFLAMEAQNERLRAKLSELIQTVHDQEAVFKRMQAKTLKDIQAEIVLQAEAMELEKKEMEKQRIKTKNMVNNEIQKLRGLDQNSNYEFRRINALIQRLQDVTKILVEDQMLAQMLGEQDLIDRKQISLMGYKKNQQILGTNQYAMQNNFTKSPTTKNSEQKNFWDLRIKNKEYNQVVKSQNGIGDNIRGQDTKNTYEQASTEILQKNVDIELNNTIINKHIAEMQQQHNEQGLSFIERYQSTAVGSNTIQIDKNCASCQSGFAHQVLSHIKIACLSYVNQPIIYQDMKYQFYEVMQIKEYLLQNCQIYMQEYNEFMNQNDSRFGIMPPLQTSQFRLGVGSNGRIPVKLNRENEYTIDCSSFDDRVQIEKGSINLERRAFSDDREHERDFSPQLRRRDLVRSRPKFQIDTLNALTIARDQQQLKDTNAESAAKAMAEINQIVESRKKQSVDLKVKSIQLCLNQIRDARMSELHGRFDVKGQEPDIWSQSKKTGVNKKSRVQINSNQSSRPFSQTGSKTNSITQSLNFSKNKLDKSMDMFKSNNNIGTAKRSSTQMTIQGRQQALKKKLNLPMTTKNKHSIRYASGVVQFDQKVDDTSFTGEIIGNSAHLTADQTKSPVGERNQEIYIQNNIMTNNSYGTNQHTQRKYSLIEDSHFQE